MIVERWEMVLLFRRLKLKWGVDLSIEAGHVVNLEGARSNASFDYISGSFSLQYSMTSYIEIILLQHRQYWTSFRDRRRRILSEPI